MKKNFYLIFVLAFFIGGMMSCNKDDEPKGIIDNDSSIVDVLLEYNVDLFLRNTYEPMFIYLVIMYDLNMLLFINR